MIILLLVLLYIVSKSFENVQFDLGNYSLKFALYGMKNPTWINRANASKSVFSWIDTYPCLGLAAPLVAQKLLGTTGTIRQFSKQYKVAIWCDEFSVKRGISLKTVQTRKEENLFYFRRVRNAVLDPDGRDVDGVRRGHCRRLHCHLRRLPDIPLPIQAQPTGLYTKVTMSIRITAIIVAWYYFFTPTPPIYIIEYLNIYLYYSES